MGQGGRSEGESTGVSFTHCHKLERLEVKLGWCLRRNSRPCRRISRRGPQGQPHQRQNDGGRASSQVGSWGTREEQREHRAEQMEMMKSVGHLTEHANSQGCLFLGTCPGEEGSLQCAFETGLYLPICVFLLPGYLRPYSHILGRTGDQLPQRPQGAWVAP